MKKGTIQDPKQFSLPRLRQSGYWFCLVCERPTELNMDGPLNVCQFCGSPRVRLVEGGTDG